MVVEILIVEDEGLIALDLKTKLEMAGYAVPAVVDNASEAFASVKRLRPSLVLVDIRLQGSPDGIVLANRIRYRFRVPVMFVTSHADPETIERAKFAEPLGFIVKPFHNIDFRARIEPALWRFKMEQRFRDRDHWFSATFGRND